MGVLLSMVHQIIDFLQVNIVVIYLHDHSLDMEVLLVTVVMGVVVHEVVQGPEVHVLLILKEF
jgi:hypothetical protein